MGLARRQAAAVFGHWARLVFELGLVPVFAGRLLAEIVQVPRLRELVLDAAQVILLKDDSFQKLTMGLALAMIH